jgi:hypothetical protein
MHAVNVFRARLDAHQDDRAALALHLLGLVGREHDLAGGGPRRGGQAAADDVALRLRVDGRVEQLVERGRVDAGTASSREIRPSPAMSTAILRAALAVRLPERVCSIQSLPFSTVNSRSCMSR